MLIRNIPDEATRHAESVRRLDYMLRVGLITQEEYAIELMEEDKLHARYVSVLLGDDREN